MHLAVTVACACGPHQTTERSACRLSNQRWVGLQGDSVPPVDIWVGPQRWLTTGTRVPCITVLEGLPVNVESRAPFAQHIYQLSPAPHVIERLLFLHLSVVTPPFTCPTWTEARPSSTFLLLVPHGTTCVPLNRDLAAPTNHSDLIHLCPAGHSV